MKAVETKKSGTPDVLKIVDIPVPRPKPDEIRVKIHNSSVTRGDVFVRKLPRLLMWILGMLFGFKPKDIPGTEFAGVVEEIGPNVTKFYRGDEVFGTTTGLKVGGNAEYVHVPEKWKNGVVAKKSKEVSFEDAAVLPVAGMTTLFFYNKADIKKGSKVLVYGASGSVGNMGVQIAKSMGAKVTGIASSKNSGLVTETGADYFFAYDKDDLTKLSDKYDVIFDAVGKSPKSVLKKHLAVGGKFFSIKTPTKEITENLVRLDKLAAEGKIKSYIEKHYTLDEIREAHTYVESGRKKGNVVLDIA